MTRLGEALKRLAESLLRIREQRPREIEDAIARDGMTPEQLEAYHRAGGGIAPPDAPKIDEGGI